MTPECATVAITGVSRGLGRALVGEFAARGQRVAGCARSTGELDELRCEYGAQHDFATVDVRSDSAVAGWAAHVIATVGVPDLLVNSAGLINRNAPLWNVPCQEFDDVVDVNVKGVASVLRHFLPSMIARGSGVVVVVSSEWGRSTSPEVAPYCATKWAVEGLTRALASELPPGLAAVAVNPGIIDTDMLRTCFGAASSHYESPRTWAARAAPFLLALGAADNGRSVSVPG